MYGSLYNWYAVETEMLCPNGWHVPTDKEWKNLIYYLGGEKVAGGKLREIGLSHWISPNEGATNESGFTALPGGSRYGQDGKFDFLGDMSVFWSATCLEDDDVYAYFFCVNNSSNEILNDIIFHKYGLSVRCIKDSATLKNSGVEKETVTEELRPK
jgi:uncharacterized protein (TIGR02145 family)